MEADSDLTATVPSGLRARYPPDMATMTNGDQAKKQPSSYDADSSHPPHEGTPLLPAFDPLNGKQPTLPSTSSQLAPWEAWEHLPRWRRPSIYWLVAPFSLFTLAFGTTLVPKINLILVLICRDHAASMNPMQPMGTHSRRLEDLPSVESPLCRNPDVQVLVAQFALVCTLLAGISSAFTSPVIGALSDRYGRTRLIVLATLGAFASELLTVAAARMPDVVSVQWIMFGFVLDGICGSFIAIMAINHAYATDITPPLQRNVVFGFFHGCLFAGIAFGPILGGYITQWSGSLVTVFYFAIAAHAVFMLSMLFLVPESLTKERQLAARELPYKIYAPLGVLWPELTAASPLLRRNLVLLAAADTISFGVAMGAMTVTILYGELRFGWGNLESSRFLSAVNISRVANLLIGLPVLNRIFRSRASSKADGTPTSAVSRGSDALDVGIIRFSFAIELLGFIGYAAAPTGPLFVLAGVVASLGGIGSPTMQSSLTKHVPAHLTGQLLGATGLLHAIARVVTPSVFNLLYARTVRYAPQTVFVCFAAMFFLGNLAALGIRKHAYNEMEKGGSEGDRVGSVSGELHE